MLSHQYPNLSPVRPSARLLAEILVSLGFQFPEPKSKSQPSQYDANKLSQLQHMLAWTFEAGETKDVVQWLCLALLAHAETHSNVNSYSNAEEIKDTIQNAKNSHEPYLRHGKLGVLSPNELAAFQELAKTGINSSLKDHNLEYVDFLAQSDINLSEISALENEIKILEGRIPSLKIQEETLRQTRESQQLQKKEIETQKAAIENEIREQNDVVAGQSLLVNAGLQDIAKKVNEFVAKVNAKVDEAPFLFQYKEELSELDSVEEYLLSVFGIRIQDIVNENTATPRKSKSLLFDSPDDIISVFGNGTDIDLANDELNREMERLIDAFKLVNQEEFESKIQQCLQQSALDALNEVLSNLNEVVRDIPADEKEALSLLDETNDETESFIADIETYVAGKVTTDELGTAMSMKHVFESCSQMQVREKLFGALIRIELEKRQEMFSKMKSVHDELIRQQIRLQIMATFCKMENKDLRLFLEILLSVCDELSQIHQELENTLKWIKQQDELQGKEAERTKMRAVDAMNPVVQELQKALGEGADFDSSRNPEGGDLESSVVLTSVDAIRNSINNLVNRMKDAEKFVLLGDQKLQTKLDEKSLKELELLKSVFEFSVTAEFKSTPMSIELKERQIEENTDALKSRLPKLAATLATN